MTQLLTDNSLISLARSLCDGVFWCAIQAIETCLKMAKDRGIKGNAITPFILNGVKELTKGKSLEANIKLVKNNAAVGAQIAVCLSSQARL